MILKLRDLVEDYGWVDLSDKEFFQALKAGAEIAYREDTSSRIDLPLEILIAMLDMLIRDMA